MDTHCRISHADMATARAITQLSFRGKREDLDQLSPRFRQTSIWTCVAARQVSDEMANRRNRHAELVVLRVSTLEMVSGRNHNEQIVPS